jgi:hypothetical protein
MRIIAQRLLRLERVEAASRLVIRMRFGYVTRLPREYTGERHLVVTKQLPPRSPGQEWVEFEERPGPKPEQPSGRDNEHIINISCVGAEEER